MPPIQLIAVHRVHYAKDGVAEPGQSFAIDADLGAKLIASKAAKADPAKPATPAATVKSGKRKTAPPKAEAFGMDEDEADAETLI